MAPVVVHGDPRPRVPAIRAKLETLNDVGLGYIHLGQPATQLSEGEGGPIVAEGTPEDVVRVKTSRAGRFLREVPGTGAPYSPGKEGGTGPGSSR